MKIQINIDRDGDKRLWLTLFLEGEEEGTFHRALSFVPKLPRRKWKGKRYVFEVPEDWRERCQMECGRLE